MIHEQGYQLGAMWYSGALLLEKVALVCIAYFTPPTVRRVVPLALAAAVIATSATLPLCIGVHRNVVDKGVDLLLR